MSSVEALTSDIPGDTPGIAAIVREILALLPSPPDQEQLD